LVADGWNVTGVTRDPGGLAAKALQNVPVRIVQADLEDRHSLPAVLKGADAVYFVGQSLQDRWDSRQAIQGINAVNAAAAVGVSHFIYQSALTKNAPEVLSLGSKRAIEARLLELPMPHTVMRPDMFMEACGTYFPLIEADDGMSLVAALPPKQLQGVVAADDIGRAAAAVAADPKRFAGSSFDLVGDRLTFEAMAAAIGEASNRKVTASQLPFDALEQQYPQLRSMFEWLSVRPAEGDSASLPALIGTTTKFSAWARQKFGQPAAPRR